MQRRYLSIDFLRGFAIFAMIQGHIWEYYVRDPSGFGKILHTYFVGPLGGYAAPLFALISGTSAYLLYKNNKDRENYRSLLIIRGLLLLGLTFVINISASRINGIPDQNIVNWGIIQVIGFCILFVPFFASIRWGIQLAIISFIILLGQVSLDRIPLLSILTNGFAPPIPWSALFFSGFLLGSMFFGKHQLEENNQTDKLIIKGLLAIIPALMILNALGVPFEWTHRSSPTSLTIIGFTWLFICILAISRNILDRHKTIPNWAYGLTGLGQHALTVYYIQFVTLIFGAVLYSSFVETPKKFGWPMYFPLTLAFMVGLHLLVNLLWRKYNYRYSLEWFLTGIIKRIRKPPLLEISS